MNREFIRIEEREILSLVPILKDIRIEGRNKRNVDMYLPVEIQKGIPILINFKININNIRGNQ